MAPRLKLPVAGDEGKGPVYDLALDQYVPRQGRDRTKLHVPGFWHPHGDIDAPGGIGSYSITWALPVGIPNRAATLTGLGISIVGAATMSGATYMGEGIGVYAPRASGAELPGDLLLSAGRVDATSTGYKTITGLTLDVSDYDMVWVLLAEERDGGYSVMHGLAATNSVGDRRYGMTVPKSTFGTPAYGQMGYIHATNNPHPTLAGGFSSDASSSTWANYPYIPYLGVQFS